jgi:hypothetical protein
MRIITQLATLKSKDLVKNAVCRRRDGKASLKIMMVEL